MSTILTVTAVFTGLCSINHDRFSTSNFGYGNTVCGVQERTSPTCTLFKDTDAIIFDMRGYPNGTAWTIAPYLADEPMKGAALFDRPMLLGPDEERRQVHTFTQRLPEPRLCHLGDGPPADRS